MADFTPVPIIGDGPAEKKEVAFGFEVYSKTLTEIIANRENRTPLVIGVHGPWGSGKTTLMKALIANLAAIDELKPPEREKFRTCKSVWFQAWKHAAEDAILAALIEEILRTMKVDGFFEGCKPEIEKLIERFNVGKFIGKAAEKLTGIDVSQFFDDLPHKGRSVSTRAFRNSSTA